MSKGALYVKLAIIILLAVASAFVVFDRLSWVGIDKTFPFRQGLDLQGGTHLVYEGDLSSIAGSDRGDAMSSVRDVIERRVNAFGVSEPVVQVAGENRLIVELPGIKNIEEAVKQIGLTPFLEFRTLNSDYVVPEGEEADLSQQFIPSGLSGKHLTHSDIIFDPNTNQPRISLKFNSEGRDLFAQLTRENINEPIAIFLDGIVISAPIVQTEITSGEAVITGNFTLQEAKDLATRLNAGALPVPIKLIQQQNIGPSLGRDSIDKSVIAGLLGFLAVALFMIIYYRLPGLISVIALLIYALIVLAVFKLVPVTLTLAGVAGFILSVGVAVDANILIFERTREELRAGLPMEKSLEEGFKRAWAAIRDSNISSLITVFILGYFGTSLIRGFALTLGIGILVSMFTAIIISRTILRLFVVHNILKRNADD